MKEKDPTGRDRKKPGAKLDSGKPQVVRGVFHYFPRAIKEVARVSEFGARKYTWNGWESAPAGVVRYTEAMGRHILDEAIDGEKTPDSEILHGAHLAWNALARLELNLREKEKKSGRKHRKNRNRRDKKIKDNGALGMQIDTSGGDGSGQRIGGRFKKVRGY